MTLDMSRPIDDMIQFCNENDLDFWLNISPSTTDQGTIDLITFLGTHLKPGLKLYAEWANEIWNFGNQPYYWATINGYSAGISDENSFGPFQCVESKRYWDLGKPAWIAAGRDGNDFLRVLAGQHPDTSKAAGHAQTCNAHGVTFDRYATAPYLPNQPAFNYVADGSYNAASTATWTTEQHIDVLEANYTFGGFEHEPGYIIDALTGKQSDGSHLYPQFVGVPLVVYEGGTGSTSTSSVSTRTGTARAGDSSSGWTSSWTASTPTRGSAGRRTPGPRSPITCRATRPRTPSRTPRPTGWTSSTR
jgi:hypothetical protein